MTYFVSYNYSAKNGSFGFGNFYITTDEIMDQKFMQSLAKEAEDSMGGTNVVILNVIKLDEESEQEIMDEAKIYAPGSVEAQLLALETDAIYILIKKDGKLHGSSALVEGNIDKVIDIKSAYVKRFFKD